MAYYKKQPRKDWEDNDTGVNIDPKVLLLIMQKLEKKHYCIYAKDFNYTKVLETKGLTKYLDRIGKAKLENRMVYSYMKKTSGQQIETGLLDKDDDTIGISVISIGNKMI